MLKFAQFFLFGMKSDVPVQLPYKKVFTSQNKLQKHVKKFLLLPGITVSKLP